MEDSELTAFFDRLIEENDSYDIADAELRRYMTDDPTLRRAYRQWCRDRGSTDKMGFWDYCEEHQSYTRDVWDSLNSDDV